MYGVNVGIIILTLYDLLSFVVGICNNYCAPSHIIILISYNQTGVMFVTSLQYSLWIILYTTATTIL